MPGAGLCLLTVFHCTKCNTIWGGIARGGVVLECCKVAVACPCRDGEIEPDHGKTERICPSCIQNHTLELIMQYKEYLQ